MGSLPSMGLDTWFPDLPTPCFLTHSSEGLWSFEATLLGFKSQDRLLLVA